MEVVLKRGKRGRLIYVWRMGRLKDEESERGYTGSIV